MNLGAYQKIIEAIFLGRFQNGNEQVPFTRDDIESTAQALGLERPKNLGDVVYTFRFRRKLPESIMRCSPPNREWIIRQQGDGLYVFALVDPPRLSPSSGLIQIRVPDATPGLIARYALNDEQALLAIVRYNRLIDIFTGVACFSLQSHLRTKVPGVGQIETDEIYLGVDKRGVHHVFPVQAKGGSDRHSIVQIEQDVALCEHKFPHLTARPLAVQFLNNGAIAMLEFVQTSNGLKIAAERHYSLVENSQLTEADLEIYRRSSEA